ncbi:hypothetical protein [Sphaerisporangium sp. TRM90804]|uniref:TRAFAC clade GTPase domain-containing protein n=1 Tax=Sphaerisporangium sp. TRM90804 TaxID=3031113 RepID=UPI00244A6854|nr:hypothetical protein [Sphaerisporangium sp. TRM90804]MDH2427452.1 hypothetical protein [Sphaerisporangium sp. TRM90804]
MIVAVLLVVLAVVLAVRASRLRGRRAARPITVTEEAPTFQIVALGLAGSGKTLLLASMYNRLQTPAGQSYFLTVPPRDRLLLNEWYAEMADTRSSHSWPRGTLKGESRQFTFTVQTFVSGAAHDILRLKYLEYAGELLSEVQDDGSSERQEELFEQARSADALFGVIDGYWIKQHLDRNAAGGAHLRRTLDALLPAMIHADRPITFIITKWDLLADLHPDEATRLSIVRDVLTSNDHFRTLVALRGGTRVVRLVPVSAVGPGFATIDEAGEIVKTSRQDVHPTNVDIPLSAVVPDLFEHVESRLDHEGRRALEAELRRRTRQGPLEALTSLGVFAGHLAGRTLLAGFGPVAGLAGDALLGLFLDSRAGAPGERERALATELGEAERRMENLRRARHRVIQDMRRKVDILEDRLPHSRLTHGL